MGSGKVREVALDTNMLLAVAKFRVDVFAEAREKFGKVDFIVPKQVLLELGKIKKEGKKMENAVVIAEELMRKNCAKVKNVDARGADSALVKMAKNGAVVATNDAALRKRIKKFGRVIYLRKKKMLFAEG